MIPVVPLARRGRYLADPQGPHPLEVAIGAKEVTVSCQHCGLSRKYPDPWEHATHAEIIDDVFRDAVRRLPGTCEDVRRALLAREVMES